MVIISSFELDFKIENGEKYYFCVKIENRVPCPKCSKRLKYRDSVHRTFKEEGGDKNNLIIRRLKCCVCSSLHRELPDFLSPYKHYTTDTIENVVDEVIDSEDFDYPSEATMIRWKEWISRNIDNINGHLKSISFRALNFSEELLRSGICLLSELQKKGEGWLGVVVSVIYNTGNFLPP